MANHFRNEGDALPLPDGDYSAGTFVTIAGKTGIVNEDYAAGSPAAARITGVVHVDAEGGTQTFSDGDSVFYNATNNTAQITSGDLTIGTAVGDQTGVAAVKVLLNGA